MSFIFLCQNSEEIAFIRSEKTGIFREKTTISLADFYNTPDEEGNFQPVRRTRDTKRCIFY